jgi:hypothetical protein
MRSQQRGYLLNTRNDKHVEGGHAKVRAKRSYHQQTLINQSSCFRAADDEGADGRTGTW